MELRTTIPAPAMKPIMEVAVKNAPNKPWAGRIPTKEKGIAAMITSGVLKDWNQPTTRTKIRIGFFGGNQLGKGYLTSI